MVKYLKFLFSLVLFIVYITLFNSCGKKIQIPNYLKPDNIWSHYGYDSERRFFVDDSLHLPLKILYRTELKAGLNYSSVTTMDKFLFVGDLKGNVYKIALNSGKIENYNNFKQPILTNIMIKENELFIPLAATKEKMSYLISYDLVKGEEKKRIPLEGSVEKEILIVNGDIFLATTSGIIYKIRKDLVEDWKIETGSQIYSHPAAGDKFLVTGTIDGWVYIISYDGKINKKFKVNNSLKSGFSIDESKIYFGDAFGFMYCYDYGQEKFLFTKKLDAPILAIPSIDRENIYIGDLKGNVYALSKQTGDLKWKKLLGGLINNAILIVGNKLVVPNFQKKIFILDKFNGEILQEIELDGRIKFSPVYIDHKLILGCDDKKIICLSN